MSEEDLPEENQTKSTDKSDSDIDIDALVDEVAGGADDGALAEEWAAAMEESGDSENEDDEAKPAPLEQFDSTPSADFNESNPNLDVILDIPVTISM